MQNNRNFPWTFPWSIRAGLQGIGLLLVLACASTQAMATRCMGVPAFPMPALNANLHAASIGTPISPWGTGNGAGVSCEERIPDYRGGHLGELYLDMPARVSTYTEDGVTHDVFPTNINGIGFVLGYQQRGAAGFNASGFCSQTWQATRAGAAPQAGVPLRINDPCSVINGRANVLSGGLGRGGAGALIHFSYSTRVRFIRTGSQIGAGSISAASLGHSCYREYTNDHDSSPNPPFTLVQGHCNGASGSTGGAVTVPAAPTCTFTDGLNRNIRMNLATFNEYKGRGSTSVPTPLAFNVSCQNTTRLSYSFTGETESSLPSVLRNLGKNPNPSDSVGKAAQGIGVQLLNADSQPVNMGTTTAVTGNVNTPRPLRFTLRYYFLASKKQDLRAGDVTARVTINVNYE